MLRSYAVYGIDKPFKDLGTVVSIPPRRVPRIPLQQLNLRAHFDRRSQARNLPSGQPFAPLVRLGHT